MKTISEMIAENKMNNNILTDELIATLDPESEEIREADGERDIYCKKCGTRRTCFQFRGKGRCLCKCKKEAIEEKDRKREAAMNARKIANMRNLSLLGARYRGANFERAKIPNENYRQIHSQCKDYCEEARKHLEDGRGIYLYGNSGSGKTHLTACIANRLIDNGYSVLFTNFANISSALRATYNKNSTEEERSLLNKLARVDFLFIDDFGKESLTAWLQARIFDIVDARYNAFRPMIISSNHTLAELMTQRGIDEPTIQRIAQVSDLMELNGESFRMKRTTV